MFNKTLSVPFLILLCCLPLKAQKGDVTTEIRTGHNAVYGGFAAVSLDATYELKQCFSIGGGIQYNSIGKISAEISPSYFHDIAWGRIAAEVILHYSGIAGAKNFAAGAGLALSSKWISCRAGYYFRTLTSKACSINEPFNIYYRFGVNCLPMLEKWDLQLYMTNCEKFELERHYQPSFIAQAWHYPTDRFGVTLGICYKPAGMFNLSTDYYQTYIKAGICYRW